MQLRNAEINDSKMLFNWANDTEVRKMAFSSEVIIWESHDKWYRSKLEDPNSRIYIITDEHNSPIGQIRFDIISDNEAEVDVHTKTGLRGKGIGTIIINLGTDRLFEETNVSSVQAVIKQENIKSIKAFSKAGYKKIGEETIKDFVCFRMIKERG